MSLSAFWHAAARLAGRVDFVPLRPALLQGPLPPAAATLCAAGIAPRHIAALRTGGPLAQAGPHLTMVDPQWPGALLQVPHAPAVLFVRGQIELLQQPAVAVVGSRRCTSTGTRMARRLAQAVVERGGVVVSGLAHGIDQAAHEASLAHTIAVLGQGLQARLTSRQQRLADSIVAAGGLVLTEFLPHTPASRWTFPQRNRIIAGLSRATIVVEAARKSGALITARQALALGRDVLAVPGSPLSPASVGCLDIIEDGAAMARGSADIDRILPQQQRLRLSTGSSTGGPAVPEDVEAMLDAGVTVEQLAQRTGWPLPRAVAMLMALELTGRVERLPGDRFSTSRPD